MQYSPGVHTQEALATELDNIYQRQSDVYLVGSLGRATVYSTLVGTPYVEFPEEHLTTRPDGTTRDIDVANLDATIWQTPPEQTISPFTLDNFSSGPVRIEMREGQWVLISKPRKFEAELDPRVMEPVKAKIVGVSVVTVPSQTHKAILGIKGVSREKDQRHSALLEAAIEASSAATLPPEIYDPFEELRESWKKDPVLKFREAYRHVMPPVVRSRLTPLHAAAMKMLNRG